MSSGVAVDDKCIEVFNDLKLKKKYKFVVFKLNADNTAIVVDSLADKATYDQFIAAMPPNDCRYALYDLDFEKEGEGSRNKICFFAWSPESSKVKQKMLYAASKDALRKKLVGVATEIQATDLGELKYDVVKSKADK